MDILRKEDERVPFVLKTNQIADLNRRTSRRNHPLAHLVTVATHIPASAYALAAIGVRAFHGRANVLSVPTPTHGRTRIALGNGAAAAVRRAIAGRTSGYLFDEGNGSPIVPDADAVAYADELMQEDGEGPLPFKWTFRSLREGVAAGMADDGVLQNVVEAQAGLRRLETSGSNEAFLRIQERAASDWWSAQLGVPGPETDEVLLATIRHVRWRDRPTDDADERGHDR